MPDCDDYTGMCAADTVIRQCQTPVLPLPTTKDVSNYVTWICGNMTMPGCDACLQHRADCDYLSSYSNLCTQMPTMTQCNAWNGYCAITDIAEWPICPGSPSNPQPVMMMYFHWSILDYVLFEKWVPRTVWQYSMSLLAIFIFAILHEGLKAARQVLEEKWRRRFSSVDATTPMLQKPVNSDGYYSEHARFAPFSLSVDVPRALLRFVETLAHFLLMLVAMTFNVGLFLAVVVGAGVGALIFGRFSYKIECH